MAGVDIPAAAQTSIQNNTAERASAMAYGARVANRLLTIGRFPSLTRDMIATEASEPVLAQIWDVLSFKDMAASIKAEREGRDLPATLVGTITLEGEALEVRGEMLTDHHYSRSSASNVRGRKRLLVAGKFERVDNGLEVSPYIIGDLLDRGAAEDEDGFGFSSPWRMKVRVYPEQIRAFERVRDTERGTAREVRQLGEIPEEDVKNAFAAILGEPFVPKDWGGEKSDLQTNHVVLDGAPTAAAFAFKGPGVSGELHPNRMGKRGDQLIRAFDEPVDLIVIQHHNKIANTVVREAESFASNPSRPRRYCILDGADTVRILKAYDTFPPRSCSTPSKVKQGRARD
jgi:hypothetical protein